MNVFNVREFGARPGGQENSQESFQRAIDVCSQNGGGRIIVPPGRYVCGTIRMKSNIELHLETGAVIRASTDPAVFPVICPTPYGNLPGQIQALLWAEGVDNIAITGNGVIDGAGENPLWGETAAATRFRPALIFYKNCRNVKFQDVTLLNSTFWTLHLLRCHDVFVRGVSIFANQQRINTDGIDPDGCTNVIISDCLIRTGDDCIVVKSTEGDPCENITISNCILSSSCAALKIGTEAIGNIRNISFNNCVIQNTDVGLALYMKDGSVYENILFTNIIMEVRSGFPLLVDITPRYYREPRVGAIRGVLFQNIMITGPGRCLVEGRAESPVENIQFRNITWNITGTIDAECSEKPTGARRVELDPDSVDFGRQPFHFIMVEAKDVHFSDVRIYDRRSGTVEDRKFFFARNVDGIHLGGVTHPFGDKGSTRFENVIEMGKEKGSACARS